MHADLSLAKNWEQAQLLYLQGTSGPEIARIIGCKRGTLEARISRAGLPAIREKQRQNGRSERTKQKIAAVAENIADELSLKTPKSAEGLNQHADTLQKVTKAAALVYGWGESSVVPVVVGGLFQGFPDGDLEAEPDEPEVIDVGSELAVTGPDQPNGQ